MEDTVQHTKPKNKHAVLTVCYLSPPAMECKQ